MSGSFRFTNADVLIEEEFQRISFCFENGLITDLAQIEVDSLCEGHDFFTSISRAKFSVDYPTNFTLIAAMNPCPCGYLGDPHHHCRCTPDKV